MQRISPVHQQQKHKQLHRRQRGVLLPVNDPEDTVSSVAVSSLSTSPAGGRGSKAKVEEDDDEDGGSQALSTCSTTCLSTYLGSNCRTVSCMCNNPELANANTCIAASCPLRDRGVFLTNIQAWCGNAQAVALLTPGVGIISSSTVPAKGRSSTVLSASSVSTTASILSLSDSASLASESITGSDVLSSSVVSLSSSTTRRVATRTTTIPTTAEQSDGASLQTGRVNPKITDSDLASSSSNDNGTNEKKGASSGTIAGIVCGMLLAFILIGLCAWYVRKSLLGRNKRGKEFLRSSDPGDWVNNDFLNTAEKNNGNTGYGNGDIDEKDGEYVNQGGERPMQDRNTLSNVPQNIHPGIGAYGTRELPAHPSTSAGSEFGLYSQGQNYRQSHQKQYEDMHASLAYPSHIGVSPSSPYHTHPQFYPQAYSSQSQYITPHTSMQSMNNTIITTPRSAGLDSTMANLSHHNHQNESIQGSPYPESITMTPETIHATANGVEHNGNTALMNNGVNASEAGKHQSIPFIIPVALQGVSNNVVDTPRKRESQQQPQQNQIRHSQTQHSYSGSMSGSIPRSLIVGGQGNRTSLGNNALNTGHGQNGSIQSLAQGIPLPTSPPIRNASLPMPLPGMIADPNGNHILQQQPVMTTEVKEEVQVAAVEGESITKAKNGEKEKMTENPFLDFELEKEENGKVNGKKRESFEGLAYLS